MLAEVIKDKLGPIRQKIEELISEPQYVEQVLEKGAERASVIAEQTWHDVKSKVGLEVPELIRSKLSEKTVQ